MTVQIVKSRFKNLIVSGCSYTYNNSDSSYAWANLLADWAGLTVVNLAVPGAGNTHIANSIILYLEQHRPDPADTLVMAMWSGPDRADFIVDSTRHIEKYNVPFSYDNHSEFYMVGSLHWDAPVTQNNEFNLHYLNLQSKKSLALQSWLNFNNLTNYLKVNGYEYRYTTFRDILYNQGRGAFSLIDELDLKLDLTNWILCDERTSLDGYAIYNNQLLADSHPAREAQEGWTKELLIPKLLAQGLVESL